MNAIRSVSLFSNYLNGHQLPVCQAILAQQTVKDFHFVSLSNDFEVVGRERLDDEYPFVIKAYKEGANANLAMDHALGDDLVIFGDMAGKEQYVSARMRSNLLSFRYAERLLKRGLGWRLFPPKIKRTKDWFLRYADKRFYCLCASAYTSHDLSLFGFPQNKCFKWGYFPSVNITPECSHHHDKLELLWVGRLIDWKRPVMALEAATFLLKNGIPFRLRVVGDGRLSDTLRREVGRRGLGDYVSLCGEQPHLEACRLMRESDILLVTSNRKEGWGAVINEAMSCGCVVIASAIAGAAPYLIEDGVNGLLFASDDVSGMCRRIQSLTDGGSEAVAEMGNRARQTILESWNANEAAKRLFSLASSLDDGLGSPYRDGPCSPAEIYTDDWYPSSSLA